MKISRITAYAIKIPRELAEARGTAGSPAPLSDGSSDYRFAATYQTLYSSKIETALVKIETDTGITGWGEAQSPLAPGGLYDYPYAAGPSLGRRKSDGA